MSLASRSRLMPKFYIHQGCFYHYKAIISVWNSDFITKGDKSLIKGEKALINEAIQLLSKAINKSSIVSIGLKVEHDVSAITCRTLILTFDYQTLDTVCLQPSGHRGSGARCPLYLR